MYQEIIHCLKQLYRNGNAHQLCDLSKIHYYLMNVLDCLNYLFM